MRMNRLDMAQPAVESHYPLSHAITVRRACPPPWRVGGGEMSYSVVGHLTNFVEIMVPAFSGQAWREVYEYLDPDNVSGWGYDFIPLGRKGIVDAMPVVHTRPVRSTGPDPVSEFERFLDNQGLLHFGHVDQGWLFEARTMGADTDGRPPVWRPDSTSRVSANGQGYRVIRA